jgi:hypothetical protein
MGIRVQNAVDKLLIAENRGLAAVCGGVGTLPQNVQQKSGISARGGVARDGRV